jgi:MFS transporter, DHA3 family, tetracycline resistance protein
VRHPGAYRLFLIYCGVSSFLFALAYTVAAVYRVQSAGLSPLQLVLVGTTLEVSYFLLNVPTGVVADTYSRRLSVIIGVFFWGVGLAVEGSFPTFAAILLAQVFGALGYTFVEGAIEAWLSDEIGEEAIGQALLRGGQVGRIAGFFGIGGSVALASARLNLPLLAAGIAFLGLGLYLVATMREPGFRRPPRAEANGLTDRVRGELRSMRTTTLAGARVIRHRPLALTVLLVAVIFGGFSEGFDRLWEAHFLGPIGLPGLGALEPVVWFGIIEAGAMLLGIGAAELFRRRVDLERPATSIRALFGLEAALMAAVIVFALAGSFAVAVAAYWGAAVTRSLVSPVYTTWINRGVDPQARATVLSMSGQADALGQFTVGPGLGAIGSAFGLRAALTVAGLALAPALALYGRALGKVSPADPGEAVDPVAAEAVDPAA